MHIALHQRDPAEAAGGHAGGVWRGNAAVVLFGVLLVAAEIDVRGGVGGGGVSAAGENDVGVAVACQVHGGSGDGAHGGKLDPCAIAVVDIAGGGLMVRLAVGVDQIKIAVVVQIVLVDALQNPFAGHIEVVACISIRSFAEFLKSFGGPNRFLLGGHGVPFIY